MFSILLKKNNPLQLLGSNIKLNMNNKAMRRKNIGMRRNKNFLIDQNKDNMRKNFALLNPT